MIKKAPFKFVAFKSKYDNPDAYDNAISQQNAFLESQKVIPIVGVNELTMITSTATKQSLKLSLQAKRDAKLVKFTDIVRTYQTKSFGRWNIIVNNEDFDATTKYLENNLLPFM